MSKYVLAKVSQGFVCMFFPNIESSYISTDVCGC